jgi:plasmid maintenance system antidote protein VapI
MSKKCLTNEDLVAKLEAERGERPQAELARQIEITPMQMNDVFTGRRAIYNARLLEFLNVTREEHFVTKEGKCIGADKVVSMLKQRQLAGKYSQKDLASVIGINTSLLNEILKGRRDPTKDLVLKFLKLKHEVHFIPTKA